MSEGSKQRESRGESSEEGAPRSGSREANERLSHETARATRNLPYEEAPSTLKDRVDDDETEEDSTASNRTTTAPSDPLAATAPSGAERVTRPAKELTDTLIAAESSFDSDVSLAPSVPTSGGDEAVADPLIGLVVAERYRIVEQVGRGGMGIVYRVAHTRIGKLLAMKLLAGELSTNKDVVRRFKQEALTVSKLSNPHTVQVFDYGVWQHLTYLVMELVEGLDLSRTLRRQGPMPFSRVGKLMVQVCSSLSEAHQKGIVHRDVKPENIMVLAGEARSEIAKVLDFGLAKLRENPDLNEVTTQGAVIGTPYYMSPEQVLGEDVDGRTDIYSLGAVMFRALTGTYPFTANTPMAMFTKHLTEAPPSACERAPKLNIPEGVSDAIMRCMAKDKEDRFPTVDALRELLLVELNALGLPSSDRVLLSDEPTDPSLADAMGEAHIAKPKKKKKKKLRIDLSQSKIATRDEMQLFERRLRRARYGAWALGALVLIAGPITALFMWHDSREKFTGFEQEANDTAADATVLPLGRSVRGHLGARVSDDESDRDFYAFTVEGNATQHIALSMSALPNFPMCSLLYKSGYKNPWAQYCTGRAGQDLTLPALAVEPGDYFVAVIQDRNPYGRGYAPPIYENVSDSYELSIALVDVKPGAEVEPNDQAQAANQLPMNETITGTLPWVDDVDVYCASRDAAPLTWVVSDDRRRKGTVLEVMSFVGGSSGPVVRVHSPSATSLDRRPLPADVNSPWRSPVFPSGKARCIRLRLTTDPWVEGRAGSNPEPDGTPYQVTWKSE